MIEIMMSSSLLLTLLFLITRITTQERSPLLKLLFTTRITTQDIYYSRYLLLKSDHLPASRVAWQVVPLFHHLTADEVMYVCVCVYVCVYVCVCARAHAHKCICICTYTPTTMHARTHTRTHARTHTHTQTHTNTHTHTHAYICRWTRWWDLEWGGSGSPATTCFAEAHILKTSVPEYISYMKPL